MQLDEVKVISDLENNIVYVHVLEHGAKPLGMKLTCTADVFGLQVDYQEDKGFYLVTKEEKEIGKFATIQELYDFLKSFSN